MLLVALWPAIRRASKQAPCASGRKALVEDHALNGKSSSRIVIFAEKDVRRVEVAERINREGVTVRRIDGCPAGAEIRHVDPHQATGLPDPMNLFHCGHDVGEMLEHIVEVDLIGR